MNSPPMRVCVAGLWHLGTVTAACLAHAGHDVVAFDDDAETVESLRRGKPVVDEPGLGELVRAGADTGTLRFTSSAAEALAGADVLWIAYDTPIDDDDRADVEFVTSRARALLAARDQETFVVVSSQLPVGTTASLGVDAIAYVPENLQLGRAIEAFLHPDRVVVGIRRDVDRGAVQRLLRPISERIEWMTVESAELTKHALNAFLATSIAFANELALIAERVGADAREVARGLKTDRRIGSRAYVNPGAAFAGGTLARDVEFLKETARRNELPAHLLAAVRRSNDEHLQWPLRAVAALMNGDGGTIAVWGLTYKAETDTLRRSSALQLCAALADAGLAVQTHDPAVKALPPGVPHGVSLAPTAIDALDGASALVVATVRPEFRSVAADDVVARMARPNVVDPNGVLIDTLGRDPRVRYVTVGRTAT